jgi:glycosyltransferase involved in cell wall biosynthesis
MNLLFYVPQMAAYGGIERHVCGLASAAAARGHTVCLLTTSNSLGPVLRGELDHPRITFRELAQPRGSAGLLRKAFWLLSELRRISDQSWDVIYTNGQSSLSRLVWWAAGSKTRVIHHHHNAADLAEQATWSSSFRRVLRRAPRLIGCSPVTCASLNAATGRTDAHFLPYLTARPVDLRQIVERRPGRTLRFGFCGRLIPEKGIDAILALLPEKSLSDIEWHIHGAGDAYPPARFVGQPRLVYHGAYHSAEEQARALLALDALVLFSTHNEGMPLSLIEGMSAGLPWIATDRGGTRDLAVASDDCWVASASADHAELTAGVRGLADRILAGGTSRRRQRARYDAQFSPTVVTGLWLDYFQS